MYLETGLCLSDVGCRIQGWEALSLCRQVENPAMSSLPFFFQEDHCCGRSLVAELFTLSLASLAAPSSLFSFIPNNILLFLNLILSHNFPHLKASCTHSLFLLSRAASHMLLLRERATALAALAALALALALALDGGTGVRRKRRHLSLQCFQ